MSNLNEVTLIGRLGQQPKVIKGDDKPSFIVCKLATNEYWKHGNKSHSHTEWHTIEIGEPIAAFVAEYADVGDELFIRGRLRTRQWENKDGLKFSATVIKADSLQLLRKKSDTEKLSDNECVDLTEQYVRKEDEESSENKLVEALKATD